MSLITSWKIARITMQWMRGAGLTPKDHGFIRARTWMYVQNLGMEPADAWMTALLLWMDTLPRSAKTIFAMGIQRFLEQYEGRVALSEPILESLRSTYVEVLGEALLDEPLAHVPAPAPLPPASAAGEGSTLGGRIAGALEFVLRTSGPTALANGSLRIGEQGAVSFWPTASEAGGTCVAVANLRDYPLLTKNLELPGIMPEYQDMLVDDLALAIVRDFMKGGLRF